MCRFRIAQIGVFCRNNGSDCCIVRAIIREARISPAVSVQIHPSKIGGIALEQQRKRPIEKGSK
jgi:hypothetical protein